MNAEMVVLINRDGFALQPHSYYVNMVESWCVYLLLPWQQCRQQFRKIKKKRRNDFVFPLVIEAFTTDSQ